MNWVGESTWVGRWMRLVNKWVEEEMGDGMQWIDRVGRQTG